MKNTDCFYTNGFLPDTDRISADTMISSPNILPAELKVFLNHIYEYKKGVRRMILFTVNRRYANFAVGRLKKQHIDFLIQPVTDTTINLFFGRPECIRAIRHLTDRPLNLLSPEEDFILGTMLGYDLCTQCERYCKRKRNS